MPETVMFHQGSRQLQDRFGSRRIADRLEEKLTRLEFTERMPKVGRTVRSRVVRPALFG